MYLRYFLTAKKLIAPGFAVLFTFIFINSAKGQYHQTTGNGAATAPINFPGPGCKFTWTNNMPGIGLAASGTGNIPSFTAINTGSSSVTATISVTPSQQDVFAYILNKANNSVSVVNTSTQTIVTTIAVGPHPVSISITPDGLLAYVGNFGDQKNSLNPSVSVINLATNAVVATINLNSGDVNYVKVNPDGTKLYVFPFDVDPVANGYVIKVIDIATNQVIATIPIISSVFGAAITPDGKLIYMTNTYSNSVSVINTLNNTVQTTFQVGYLPYDVGITPDGSTVYVPNEVSNNVSVISTATNTVIATIPVGVYPESISISPDGTKAYVANFTANTVSVINIATNKVVATIAVGNGPDGGSFTPDGSQLYIINQNGNTVSVINTASNTVTATIAGFFSPNSSGNFITAGSNCTTAPFTYSITVNSGPTIGSGGVAGAISACIGSAAASPNIGQFTVTGSTLTNNIVATAPTGFEISQNASGGYTNSLTLIQTSGTVNSTPIYIRSAASAPQGSLSGNVILTSPGAATQNVAVTAMVNNPPVAAFTVAAAACANSTITFKDASTVSTGNTEKSWLWDFGDGQTSTLQNPTHAYTLGGSYNIVLMVTDNIGCSGVSGKTTIQVTGAPTANFTISAPDCPGQSITLADKSTTTNGTIKQWLWDFGDGTKSALANNQPFTHLFANAGVDTVKLTVVTDIGCVSAVYAQPLTINPLPIVNFMLPDVCLTDAYAQFNDQSTITDNTQSAFTYVWNFGDSYSTAANNTSTLKNPQHKYSKEGNYTVTLAVTSKYGCSAINSKPFTVNGAIPLAGFTVENKNALCSTDSVTFDDQSSVDFGNITRIVWFYDYNNHPTDSVVYTTATMRTDKKYRYSYGLFNAPLQKNYTVTMIAYSGQSCKNVVQQTITINANPMISLLPADSITLCQQDNALQIIENENGFTGTGVFSGTGISSAGLFDPKISGAGTFTINYLFTSDATGCTYSKAIKITVNPTPVVAMANSIITVLEGGQATLPAVANIASGSLSYKWSPSIGLSQPNILNPVASPLNDVTYTLTATSNTGCTASAQITVNVLKAPFVPNAFTPNGDGVNDTWDIKYLNQYPNATVQIFNRYGDKVYYSNNYPIPWDGTYKGTNLPAGTYYYIINPNSGRKSITGFVAIIR